MSRISLRAARAGGFTLVELAVVMAIVGLLLGTLMYTFSAQIEQRNFEDTRRKLDQARELLITYAIVNGRLPCPARSTSSGLEVRDTAAATPGQCVDGGGVEDYYGGTLSSGAGGGLLPGATLGIQQLDSSGFALDAWQNRIRYAVAKSIDVAGTCPSATASYHFTNKTSMQQNGITCQPSDLMICKSATGISSSACGAANQLMSTGLVVAIIFSTGKNATSSGGVGVDEKTNLKTNTALSPVINPMFVWHTPTPSDYTTGEFDDQFTWITVGELYGRLISAGVLP